MKLKLMILLASLIAAMSVQAGGHGDKAEKVEKPSFSATQTVQVVAVIDAIDREANTVTLRGPEGNTRVLQAREDSHNMDVIEVGDKVDVEYVQNMTIEVVEADGMEPGSGVLAAEAVNKEGETPAVVEMITTVETALVEDINIEANTFQLKWASGEVKEYTAQNPENLKKAEVGDMVVVSHTEAVAMKLQEVETE